MVTQLHESDPPPEDGPAWRAARADGCDMDLLEESLSLSPEERLRLHDIALRRIELLEKAMKGTPGGA
jgi:hypothetical protein